ncbi:hypothetical protein AwDysgo_05640 [Bacteroidales bacterium]|nr:hypothetical protein AwDysgo_05640 [Bacteroidales bacterium]
MFFSTAKASMLYPENFDDQPTEVNTIDEISSFGLYGDDYLKAPPGGGDPIGGVPTKDGLYFLLFVAIGYSLHKRRNQMQKNKSSIFIKKTAKILAILAIILLPSISWAQQAKIPVPKPPVTSCDIFNDDVWFFGSSATGKGGGLIFNDDGSGNKVAANASNIAFTNTAENSLSVSAPGCNGSLIFYSDHNQIYNSKHEKMLNGSFTGHNSVADGLAACYIGNNKYMLFSVNNAYEAAGEIGLDYHIIDMSRDNGYGERISSTKLENAGMSESVELIPVSGTENEYWLVYRMRSSNTIRIRKINNGVVGGIHQTLQLEASHNGRSTTGYTYGLKANTQRYDQQPVLDIATKQTQEYPTVNIQYSKISLIYPAGVISIFDFDPAIGQIDFMINLTTPNLGGTPYDAIISPDCSHVYCTAYHGTNPSISQSSIYGDYWTTPFAYGGWGGGMKIGSDGKLYVQRTGTGYLGIIPNPISWDMLTEDSYIKDGINLGLNVGGLTFSTGLTPPSVCPQNMNQAPICNPDYANVWRVPSAEVNVLDNDTDPNNDNIILAGAHFENNADATKANLSFDAATGKVMLSIKAGYNFADGEQIKVIYSVRDNGAPIAQCSDSYVVFTLRKSASCDLFTDDVWYFGQNNGKGAGITFKDNGQGGKVASGASGIALVNSWENSLSVSSPGCDGNLIFYTDHDRIFNSKHEQMKNGSFSGNTSVADGLASCYIGNNKYMLFAVNNSYGNGTMGLDYHIIDMSLDNGYGEKISSSNIEPSGMSESIELMPVEGTKNDYWLVYRMLSTREMRVRRISSGVVGDASSFSLAAYENHSLTYNLKSNSSNTMLAIIYPVEYVSPILLMNFDPIQGIISFPNISKIETPHLSGTGYGLEFSPNGKYIYAGAYNTTAAKIAQYDIENNSWSVAVEYGGLGSGMKVGPDGKMYVMRYGRYAGVIAEPNKPLTDAGYIRDGLDLGATMVGMTGLTFSTGITNPSVCPDGTNKTPIAQDSSFTLCYGESLIIELMNMVSDPDANDVLRITNVKFIYPNDQDILSFQLSDHDGRLTIIPKANIDLGRTVTIEYTVSDNSTNPVSYCAKGILTISFFDKLYGGNIQGNLIICASPTDTTLITGDQSSGGSGSFYYQWQNSNDNSNWTNIQGATDKDFKSLNLKKGYFRRISKDYICGADTSNILFLAEAPSIAYWNINAANNNWNEPTNWTNRAGVVINTIPRECTDVFIPGNAKMYPSLDTISTPRSTFGKPMARNITFHFGGELAKPQLLQYEKAFVQYNFGYYNDKYAMLNGDNLSATEMARGRWYALAAPLKSMAIGDFAFGGYPNFWQRDFKISTSDSIAVGSWSAPNNNNDRAINSNINYAISIWAGEFLNRRTELGEKAGYHTNLNQLKGIIEIPYFENEEKSMLHRGHSYHSGMSYFQYYNSIVEGFPLLNNIPAGSIARTDAYRFVFDNALENGNINGTPTQVFKMSVPAVGKEIMVGNPFMSTLDFDAFYQANKANINDYYRIFDGEGWKEYSVSSGGAITKNIAALQAFFIRTKESGGNINLVFSPELMSITRPANTTGLLKTTSSKQHFVDDVIYITASNNKGNSTSILALNSPSNENVGKLFYEDRSSIPQLYLTDADNKKLSIYAPNSFQRDVEMGILFEEAASTEMDLEPLEYPEFGSTDAEKGSKEMSLEFANIDKVAIASLSLYDTHTKMEIDLLKNSSYSFTNNVNGFNNRFIIRLGKSTTAIDDNELASIKIYAAQNMLYISSKDIIKEVHVMNVQGTKLIEEVALMSTSYSTSTNGLAKGVYIVHVVTENDGLKIQKLVVR